MCRKFLGDGRFLRFIKSLTMMCVSSLLSIRYIVWDLLTQSRLSWYSPFSNPILYCQRAYFTKNKAIIARINVDFGVLFPFFLPGTRAAGPYNNDEDTASSLEVHRASALPGPSSPGPAGYRLVSGSCTPPRIHLLPGAGYSFCIQREEKYAMLLIHS